MPCWGANGMSITFVKKASQVSEVVNLSIRSDTSVQISIGSTTRLRRCFRKGMAGLGL